MLVTYTFVRSLAQTACIQACYFVGRTNGGQDYTVLIVQVGVLLFMMFLNGFVTVPLFSLCSITLHHQHDDNAKSKKYVWRCCLVGCDARGWLGGFAQSGCSELRCGCVCMSCMNVS